MLCVERSLACPAHRTGLVRFAQFAAVCRLLRSCSLSAISIGSLAISGFLSPPCGSSSVPVYSAPTIPSSISVFHDLPVLTPVRLRYLLRSPGCSRWCDPTLPGAASVSSSSLCPAFLFPRLPTVPAVILFLSRGSFSARYFLSSFM